MICVIDIDNFFVSCEKLFAPELNGKPAVVLSNNDGCIVARSIEAKALKIPMGAPLFQVRDQLRQHGVTVFSGNFSLYCDLSDRVMSVLRNFSSNVEIYSIDEAFLDLGHIPEDQLEEFGILMRASILKTIGISASVGIAPTKTLAKIATHVVKDHKKLFARDYYEQHGRFPYSDELESCNTGVCVLRLGDQLDQRLANTDVGEIWGIGRGLADRLHRAHITTCAGLRDSSFESIKRLLGINGLKTQKELSGTISYPVSQKESIPKSVMNTRSFGKVVTNYNELNEAITRYTWELSAKLRSHKIVATYLTIYITTKRYDTKPYSKSLTIDFAEPTNSSRSMIETAQQLLQQAFLAGYTYRKAGVIASGIISEGSVPVNLFEQPDTNTLTVDSALDTANKKFGKDSIIVTSAGIKPLWFGKTLIRSPRYTTRLSEIPRVR
jgi:DNA polymerase V